MCLRDVLLRRLDPCSPPQLRISTLELLASLAELRDDRVLLDLILRPGSELPPPPSTHAAAAAALSGERGASTGAGEEDGRGRGQAGGVEALLDASPGGALEGLRVSRSMVDSFGSAFSGSPIHPNFRLFSASSHLSLEGYLVAAHQRQIHQLMEGARGSGHGGGGGSEADADMLDSVVGGGGGGGGGGGNVLQAVAAAAAAVGGEGGEAAAAAEATAAAETTATATAGESSSTSSLSAAGGGEHVEFDAAGFVREHGGTVALETRGSFLDALFDCLEVGVAT